MSNIIQLLPDVLSNQIAAGEVIQRPASVIKELMENAIDAKSNCIQVNIKQAGKEAIQVIDNGVGMSEVDARMSFERHATSKIKQVNDLFNIRTLGFRGEALASIAAVAKVILETKLQNEQIGTEITIESGKILTQKLKVTTQGTNILIKNLFFNVPARKNFLKSDFIEYKHIFEEFQHVALGYPDINFSLYKDTNKIYDLPKSDLKIRILQLFGEKYGSNLLACEEKNDLLHMHGYVGKVEVAKKYRSDQFFFVNKRFVKSMYLHHAIKNAFHKHMGKDGYHPFYVICLEIDPKRIDINIHPTKAEIQFEEEKVIYSMLHQMVTKVLTSHYSILDFKVQPTQLRDQKGLPVNAEQKGGKLYDQASQEKRAYQQFQKQGIQKTNSKLWKDFLDTLHPTKTVQQTALIKIPDANEKVSYEKENQVDHKQPVLNTSLQYILHEEYLFVKKLDQVMIINTCLAHERILYEQSLKQLLQEKHQAIERLLFPYHITLSEENLLFFKKYAKWFRYIGFEIEPHAEGNSLKVKGHPTMLTFLEKVITPDYLQKMIEAILSDLKKNYEKKPVEEMKQNLSNAMARYMCLKKRYSFNEEEIASFLEQFFRCENQHYTPNGKKIIIECNKKTLSKFFIKELK